MANHLSVVAVILPTALLLYSVGRIIYNLFLHPLRSFPGPLLARSSIVPYNKHIARGDTYRWIKALHDKYGPVVRFAPNELSFNGPGAWKDIHGFKRGLVKDLTFYGKDLISPHEPGIIRANDDRHAKIRKVFSHAFSDKALHDQQPLIKTYARVLRDRIDERAAKGEKVDLVKWLNYTTFDVMADMTFGEPMGLLDGSPNSNWVDTLFELLEYMVYMRIVNSWPSLKAITMSVMPQNLKDRIVKHQAFTAERVNKRLARQAEKPDIWSFVDRTLAEKDAVTQKEMTSTGSTFMVAGTETTATALSGALYLLSHNLDKKKRLVDEICSNFSSLEEMNMVQLAKMPYLNACIEETLRYYPPAPNAFPRTVAVDNYQICDRYVPKGTTVSIYQWSTYHSASNFHRPDDFAPERWLPEGQAEFASDRKDVFSPFSYGPRNCIGKNMAYHEMRILLATLLLHFDFEVRPESEGWFDNQTTHMLWNKPPLWMNFKAR